MHVVVIGLGGVGSWAAEALARSAVGEITLIDFDHISISNTNRQLHALDGEYGKAKVEAMSQRLKKINPELIIHEVDEFVKPENIEALLPKSAVILDATDDFLSKVSLAVWCHKNAIPLVISGGAGGKIDPTKIQIDDLSKATHDPLLSKMRGILRKEYGFEKDPQNKMKLRVVYSSEPRLGVALGGLACSGYGSAVTVTASFGLAAAAEAMRLGVVMASELQKTI
jgi:tRNA A37 threonylcarbamoyladenosine dehydratase